MTTWHRLACTHRPTGLPALTAGVLAAAVGLTACGSAGTQAGTASGGKPIDGGTLTLASSVDATPKTFFLGTDADALVTSLVYNTLVTYPHSGLTPQPSLATSWQLAKNGLSLTLDLRPGVTFSDGTPLTSKDVAYSIQTIANPKWVAQFQRTAAAVTGFDTSKANQITLKFAHPLSNIFDLLATTPILDPANSAGFAAGTSYIGTGPFTFASWQPGQKIVFKANPHYWGGKPHLAGVTLDVDVSAQTQVSELRSGEIDGALDVDGADLNALTKDPSYHVLTLTGAEQEEYLGVNVANPELKNVKLRQAVAYALDRQSIAKLIGGDATALSLPWPPYSPAYSSTLNSTYVYNPTKAKSLVAQVGKVSTLSLQYADTAIAGIDTSDIAQIIQANLKAVGIPVKLEPIQQAQESSLLISGKFGALWVLQHGFAEFTPSTLAVSAFPFNAAKNTSNFSAPSYAAAANTAWETADGSSAAARAAYQQFDQQLLQNLFIVELAGQAPRIATTAKLHDVNWGKQSPQLFLNNAYLDS